MVGWMSLIGLLLALGAAVPAQADDAPKPVNCSDKAKVAEPCHQVENGCISICSAVEPDKAAKQQIVVDPEFVVRESTSPASVAARGRKKRGSPS